MFVQREKTLKVNPVKGKGSPEKKKQSVFGKMKSNVKSTFDVNKDGEIDMREIREALQRKQPYGTLQEAVLYLSL